MQFAKYLHGWLFQLGQNIRLEISTGLQKEKKQRANVFYLPLSTAPVVQMVGLSQQAMFAAGNVSHPQGLVRATFTFSARIRSVRQFRERGGIQCRTWPIIDAPPAEGIAPVTFQLWTESGLTTGPPCSPLEKRSFDHSCMLATKRSCAERKCVRARWSIFVHL